MINIYESVSQNKRKSALVVVGFFLFIALSLYFVANAIGVYMGYNPGGLGYLGIALIISGVTSFVSYYFSDKIILGISGARPADRKKDFDFYTVAENLCIATGIPKPKLYVIEDSAPNAFATGRNPENAVICVTRGLLEKLNRTELEGVIAHEISHIRNYDILLMSVVSVLVGSVALLSDWFFRMRFIGGRKSKNEGNLGAVFMIIGIIFAILSPIIANLIKLAISRRREFLADAGSVSITKQPQGLISALTKISLDREPLEVANKATAHLYIEDPFRGKADKRGISKFAGMFNTHPPVEKRLRALKNML